MANKTGCYDCGKKAPLTSRTIPGQSMGIARCDQCDAKYLAKMQNQTKGGASQ